MVVTLLSGQLGNTMFQYAVVKTIAEEKGIPFRYYRIPETRKDILLKYALMLRNAIERTLCICRPRLS